MERKNPAMGKSINSSGNKNCLVIEAEYFFGLFLKSITIIARRANKQKVRINPASLGRLYPRAVLEKTGFIKGITFAAIVIINQLTGQSK